MRFNRLQTPATPPENVRHNRQQMKLFLSAAAVMFSAVSLMAVEPWVDSRLPMTQELELWLDASTQPAAWQAHQKPALITEARMDVWFDGSGQQRHVVQRVQSAQPRFVFANTLAAVRFDGVDDHFTLGMQRTKLDDFTAFIVAAPYSNAGEFRALLAAMQTGLNDYLTTKYAGLDLALATRDGGARLLTLKDPPRVQMLLPGFTVRPLPVALKNINNVKYRRDGKLVALGYDGNVFLLSDTDRDGLEDKAELFWDNQNRLRAPIGMALTPPNYPPGNGLFVASKGKLSLIVDTNSDDRADEEIIVAQGWEELPHGVDALGVAFDARDGSIYFGLGTANYTGAYLIDQPTGRSRYDLKSERGTILKVSADFKKREIVCTGIRFPVGMAINLAGDLFCTDQEGATWLPNGNPFDELLHIQPGRHYGFPPRHPKHLPNVIDEPSVYDYGPQHQSICGLNFNDPINDGPVFGPSWWSGNALVTGYSRGKLYRTKLAKTSAGYIAQNQLLACLNVLTVDACVSPQGDLVMATHSGLPDWGSGPSGLGRLFKIAYTDNQQAQPVIAWAASPREVRVAFDRPLLPSQLAGLAAKAKITFGEFARAGDRFETIRPGYQEVSRQMATPRFDLPVTAGSVTPNRRTLVFLTASQAQAAHYALTLPGFGRSSNGPPGTLDQHAGIDLAYDLTGVEAKWQPIGNVVGQQPNEPSSGSESIWAGWLPHLDLSVARTFTAASAEHELLWPRLRQPGKLTLRCQLNLQDMLRPAVQPGLAIDYEWPAEQITLTFKAATELVVRAPANSAQATIHSVSKQEVTVQTKPHEREWLPLEIELTTSNDFGLEIFWHSQEDARARALPSHRIFLPWATEKPDESKFAFFKKTVPGLEGGSWARGRRIFFSDEALCSQCHAVGGQGSKTGPDLSNLIHRDYESVLKDIHDPSATINPDFIAYEVTLKNGEALIGTVRTEAEDKLSIGQGPNLETVVARADVKEMRPLQTSTMPPGLDQVLGQQKLKDLLTFLLMPAPRMNDYGPGKPPASRTRAEVEGVLQGASSPPSRPRALHIVLVAGRKDHGPGEHDYPRWQKAWSELLATDDNVKVTAVWEWPKPEDFNTANAIVIFQHGKWTEERARDLDAFLARGGGASFFHYAVDGGSDPPGFAQRIGLAWSGGQSKFRHGELELTFNSLVPAHPIARNFHKVHFHDESYWQLVGDPANINLLASAVEEGEPRPLVWTREAGQGRVFVSILGHYSWTFDDPLFRLLLLRGIAWTAKEPVDRFNEMIWLGTALKE